MWSHRSVNHWMCTSGASNTSRMPILKKYVVRQSYWCPHLPELLLIVHFFPNIQMTIKRDLKLSGSLFCSCSLQCLKKGKRKKLTEARVNGGSNYDSLEKYYMKSHISVKSCMCTSGTSKTCRVAIWKKMLCKTVIVMSPPTRASLNCSLFSNITMRIKRDLRLSGSLFFSFTL